MEKIECPECDKMLAVRDKSLVLSGFVDWLNEHGYAICTVDETPGYPNEQHIPLCKTYEELFADYFEIDLKKAEQERRSLLASLQSP